MNPEFSKLYIHSNCFLSPPAFAAAPHAASPYSSDSYVCIDLLLLLYIVLFLTPRLITNSIFLYFRPDRRQPFLKVPLTHMIIDECKYTCDSHFVNSTELKEKYIYNTICKCK